MQSERDKLRSEVSKVLDSKSKAIKPIGPVVPKPPVIEGLDPMMQATGYNQPNVPMVNEGNEPGYDDNVEDEEEAEDVQVDPNPHMGMN